MAEPNRKLTQAEQKRYDAFLLKEEKLLADGYKRKDITISILTANLVGTLVAHCIFFCTQHYSWFLYSCMKGSTVYSGRSVQRITSRTSDSALWFRT